MIGRVNFISYLSTMLPGLVNSFTLGYLNNSICKNRQQAIIPNNKELACERTKNRHYTLKCSDYLCTPKNQDYV